MLFLYEQDGFADNIGKLRVGAAVNDNSSGDRPRRPLAYINQIGVTQLHLRNPLVIAMWSALFPGFGHLLLSRYIRAIVLFLWEIFINLRAQINMALFYSFLGQFDLARDVIDIRWSLLYIPTYLFAVWDSYMLAVDMNKQYILASREDAPITPFLIKSLGIDFLSKKPPLVSSAWCAMVPGLGHIMLQRILHGAFVLIWWVAIVYYSNALTALHLTCFGQFDGARQVLEPQWFLNLPSVFFFCVYTTYVNSVESNRLFDREQSQFMKRNYQSAQFPFPIIKAGETGAPMYVAAMFKQTVEVELAVTALEGAGIQKNSILAVPVETKAHSGRLFDTTFASSGDSLLDLPMILGALVCLSGCIYGYILAWGPVVWGVIGAAAGFGAGLCIKLFVLKKKRTRATKSEVVILVACEENKAEFVCRTLRDNGALGANIAEGSAG